MKRGIQSAIFSPPSAQRAPEQWFQSPGQPPSDIVSGMSRGTEYPIWLAWVSSLCCVPSQLPAKINSILAKTRTTSSSLLILIWWILWDDFRIFSKVCVGLQKFISKA